MRIFGWRPVAGAVLTCILVANGDAGSLHGDDASRIAEIRAQSNAAIARHDVVSIVESLDDHYQITTGSGRLAHGVPADEAASWEAHFESLADVVYVRTPDAIEVSTYLPRAAESGQWVGTWSGARGPVEMGGRYMGSWRKIDGDWRLQSEIFVTLYCNGAGC